MDILKRLSPLLFSLLLTGCFEDFTPDLTTTPVLCLNSVITAGEPVSVQVSRSWLLTDEAAAADHSVHDASVTVYANGNPVDTTEYLPACGDRIRIEARSSTYGEAFAEVTVPEMPDAQILSATPTLTAIWPFHYDIYEEGASIFFNLTVEIRVNDADTGYNYYHLGFAGTGNGDSDDDDDFKPASSLTTGSLNYDAEPIFSEHISELDYVTGNDGWGFNFFTDRQFSGAFYTLNLKFSDMLYAFQATRYDPSRLVCRLDLTVSSISQSYYSFAASRWYKNEGLLGDAGDYGLGDPVWGYSNVSTGAGVVMARTPLTMTVDLHSFIIESLESQESF